MVSKKLAVAGGVTAGALALGASAVKTLRDRRSVEEPPYVVLGTVDDVTLRQYRETVRVETTAENERTAFRRLFEYIDGGNEGDTSIPMTAPVEVDTDESTEINDDGGVSIPMTAPVEVDDEGQMVRMAFYLPEEYDSETAPKPTDEAVHLVVEPARTLAVRTFSGRATDERKQREESRLLDTLAQNDVVVAGEPFFMGYDAPYSLPPLRRNEIAVELP